MFWCLDIENDCFVKLIILRQSKQSQASSAAAAARGLRLADNYCHLPNRSTGSSLALSVCLSASSRWKSSRPPPSASHALTSSFVLHFIVPHPHSPSLSPSLLSLTSPVSCYLAQLSLPSLSSHPWGFNHQLNVTPYLRNAWKQTHTHTHTHHLPAGWHSYTQLL